MEIARQTGKSPRINKKALSISRELLSLAKEERLSVSILGSLKSSNALIPTDSQSHLIAYGSADELPLRVPRRRQTSVLIKTM